jgi:predicted NBD/HSP70 family sugar kinase
MNASLGPAPRTATTRHVTAINRTAILDLLRTSGPLSRRDIRDRTGLGSATVERLCSAMLDEGALETVGVDRSSTGRPSILLGYVSDLRAVIVIDVTDNTARGRLVDLGGNVLYEKQEATVFDGPASSSRLDGLLRLVDHLVSAEPGVTAPLDVIGVTLPGIVDDGVVRLSTELDWHDLPLAQILFDRVKIPVHVENDANATAYAELLEGVAVGAQSAVSLVLGAGIGAGIVSDGRIYRGHRSASGEVGYLLTSPDSFKRYFTDEGDMEAKVSAAVLPYAPQGGAHVDRRMGPGFRSMMRLAGDGDVDAEGAREEFFDNLALTCAAIAVVLAPSVIVLAGAFAQYGEVAEAELSKRIVGRIPSTPRIAIGTLGFDAAITGMGALTIERARHATYLV